MRLPSNSEDKVRFLVDLYHKVRDELTDFRSKSTGYIQAYNSDVGADYPLKFKLFYPLAFSTIETLVPRYVHGLLYRHPLVEVMRAHPLTDYSAIQAASRLLNNKWLTDKRTWYDIKMMTKESLLVGSAMGLVRFKQQKRKVFVPKPPVGGVDRTGILGEYRSIYKTNRPILEHVDMCDVFPDIDRVHVDDHRFTFRVLIKGMEEIKYGDVQYSNLSAIEEMNDWQIDELPSRLQFSDIDSDVDYQLGGDAIPDHPRMILQCFTREWSDEGEVIHLTSICNEKEIIGETILPYWPWVHIRNNAMPGKFLGRSELQPIESIQLVLNDLLNMNLEQSLMALASMWIVSDEAEADLDQFDVNPNGIIQISGDPGMIRREQWGGVDAGGIKLQEILMQAGRDATGISDFLRGANPSRKEFASTVMALQQAAEARIDSRIKEHEKTGLSDIAAKFVECAQNYLVDPEFLELSDGGYELIDMCSIQGLMDFKLHAAAMGVKELERTSIVDFAGNIAQILGQEAPPEIRFTLVKALAKTFENLPEEINETLDKYIGMQNALPGGAPPNPGVNGAPGMASAPGIPDQAPNEAGAGVASP